MQNEDNNLIENNMTPYDELETAAIVVDLLNSHSQHLTAVTTKRLSVARSLAVNQLANQQTNMWQQNGNVLQWFGQQFTQHLAMSGAMLAGVMMLTFFVAQQLSYDNNLENSDAFLLASDLPPEAFADKGFDTWLVSKR